MINEKYIIQVSDYQPELLPRPTPKIGVKSETLEELGIITYECD